MLKIGSHVSMSGDKMLLAASEEAVSYGSTTFMIYTGAPQNTRRKSIEKLNIEAGRAHMEENGIHEIVVHAPYIINIDNTTNPRTFRLGVDFLQSEIERTEAIGAKQIVLHPGSHSPEVGRHQGWLHRHPSAEARRMRPRQRPMARDHRGAEVGRAHPRPYIHDVPAPAHQGLRRPASLP